MKPRLHIALSVLCGSVGGPATYGQRLAAALGEHADLQVTVLTDRPEAFAGLAGVHCEPLPMRGGTDRLRWQYFALPRALRRLRPAVYHDTKNALPSGLRMPAVVTVHDLAYHTVPATFPWASRWFLRAATAHAVRRARAVIVPSLATAADVRRFHPEAAARVHVVPHGIDPAADVPAATRAEARARLGLPERFVLHVGTLQARKNVDLVVQGVRLLRQRGLPHRAVLVGRRGWLAEAALREIERDDTALWLPHVAAPDLAALHALADAFVSPSAYEGFGLAVGDALAAGLPTVVADAGSLPELCGDAAVRLPALTATAVADALQRVLEDGALATSLRERARQRAAGFSWARAAAGHAAIYRRLAAADAAGD
ncbi:MAG: glycosyltransferase family 4 protein [Planctomycetes bacterium]|nr:glycosyltransferase family 4 protein [Planctomycetota bacterium]